MWHMHTCEWFCDDGHHTNARIVYVVRVVPMGDSRTERLRVLLTASSNRHHLTRMCLSSCCWCLGAFLASQPVASTEINSFSFDSFVGGYHVYGAVGTMDWRIVGHVPFNLAPVVSAFLKRSSKKWLAKVTGNKVVCVAKKCIDGLWSITSKINRV